MYNRRMASGVNIDTVSSFTLAASGTPNIAPYNGSTSNRGSFVVGLSEDAVRASATYTGSTSVTAANNVGIGLGLDSTTFWAGSPSSGNTLGFNGLEGFTGAAQGMQCEFSGLVTAGSHFLQLLAVSFGSGAPNNFNGDFGDTTQGGMLVNVFC